MLAEQFHFSGADLLLELPQRRLPRLLAFIDTALRHLPALDRLVDALADEDFPFAVQHHHADAGSVRESGGGGLRLVHRQIEARTAAARKSQRDAFTASAETGTKTKPRESRVSAHAATRAIVTGKAEPIPMMEPVRCASASSSASFWSIAVRLWTESSV